MGGMVHPGALSINVVKMHKPKLLIGLGQNGIVVGTGAPPSPGTDTQHSRRTERTSPVLVHRVERGKPVALLAKEGRKIVRPTDGGAGMGVGQSAGRPVVGRIRVVTSPGAQAS